MIKHLSNNEDRKNVETELSIHPEVVDRISKFQMETLKEEITSLPPIKEGDVNISTDYIFDMGDKYEVSLFIRNGLVKPINFEDVLLFLVNAKGEQVAGKIFSLREVGEVPPMSLRPWKIYFSKEEVELKDNSLNDLKLVFDNRIKAESTLKIQFEDLPAELQGENKRKLEKFLEERPLLRRGEISISAYDVFFDVEVGLSIIIIIRNGEAKSVKLEKIPVCVRDAEDNIVAKGVFQLDLEEEGIVVTSSKARLCRFVFPKEEILVDKIDLSKWTVTFNQ